MSGIRLTEVDDATIATPPAGKSTLILDDVLGWAHKDDDGITRSLQGADGVLTYQDHGNTGATETVDASFADVHRLVANAATVTLTLSGAAASGTPTIIRLLLEQDGAGGRDWAFPGSVEWGNAGEPTWTSRAAGVVDIVDLTTVDGGTVWIASFTPDGASIDWGETGDITDQAYDDVADAGVLNEVARADHLHGMPSAGGGGSLTSSNSNATGNTTMTNAGTWYDSTCSLSLAAGTWLIDWKMLIVTANQPVSHFGRLVDSTAATEYDYSETFSNLNGYRQELGGFALVTLGGTTTLKTQARADTAGNSISQNGGNGTGNFATRISAVKIA